jgi:hypothetical protein
MFMAYRAKKKKLGTKIVAWFLVIAMIGSFISTLVYYLIASS